MTVSLPKGIDAYIAGTNAHEPASIARAFAEDGIVHDEGKVQRGRAAITEWARDTVNKYRMTMTPLSAVEKDGNAVVKARVRRHLSRQSDRTDVQFRTGRRAIKSLKVG